MSLRACPAWIAVLLLVLIGAACTAAGSSGVVGVARRPVPDRAAYVAEDGQVYVVPFGGDDARRGTHVSAVPTGKSPAGREVLTARWPTWAPDGSRLAFLRVLVDPAETLTAAQVWTVGPDGADPRVVWEAADRQPIYLAWAPNSASIALLVQTVDDLELEIVDAAGGEPPRRVVRGSPLYFVWSADSRALLVHVGDDRRGSAQPDLGIVRLGPPDEWRSLGVVPGDFRAPAWSTDGTRLAYVGAEPDGTGVVSLVSPQGGDVTRVATVSTQAALALSADGARLAWAARSAVDRLLYDGVEVVTTDGRKRVRVTDDLVLAFFWSPDDRLLAYLTLDRAVQGYAWNVAEADGGNPRRLTAITPSEEQLRLLAFFDQYAISHGLWSPDSRSLVYAVGAADDRRVFGAPSRGWAVQLPIDGSAAPRHLADGSFVTLPVAPPAR